MASLLRLLIPEPLLLERFLLATISSFSVISQRRTRIRMDGYNNDDEAVAALEVIRIQVVNALLMTYLLLQSGILCSRNRHRCNRQYSILSKIPAQIDHLNGLVRLGETDCIEQLCLGRNALGNLCLILQERGGLRGTHGVSVTEQVAIFLSVISHHQKVRVVKKSFTRSTRSLGLLVFTSTTCLMPYCVVKNYLLCSLSPFQMIAKTIGGIGLKCVI